MGNADDDGYRPLPQLCFQCGGAVPWGGSVWVGTAPPPTGFSVETTSTVTPIPPMRRQSDSACWRNSSGVWASMESTGIS